MATESTNQAELPEMTPEDILSGMSTIKRMLMVGAVFAAVGYLLVGAALFLEFTQFHPLIESFFAQNTGHSLAGGGADRAGMAALNGDLAAIHKFPSLLLWLKLGGIAHILVGIFVVLAAIVRTLTMVPARLGYELEG
jgi:small-conductance mechanosensitive channel